MMPLMLAAVFSTVSQEQETASDLSNHSAANCLYVALHALDQNCEIQLSQLLEDLNRSHRTDRLVEMKDFAVNAGFKALPVRTSLESLRIRQKPFLFIANVSDQYFVIVSDVSEDMVAVEDPPRSSRVPVAAFNSRWDQSGLLLSTQELEPESLISDRLWWNRFVYRTAVGVASFAGALVLAAIIRIGWRRWTNKA
jgi:ABC-type bacteriocin/lantibiotic exporter with double-glycine peptidase domain